MSTDTLTHPPDTQRVPPGGWRIDPARSVATADAVSMLSASKADASEVEAVDRLVDLAADT